MIVVVSDLHLQHTSNDVIRWREGNPPRILECGVHRNVTAEALQLLFFEIAAGAHACKAKSVELVLAGDIFELHRTPAWFLGGGTLRPTLQPASESAPLEAKVSAILDAIARENASVFRALHAFVRHGEWFHRGLPQPRLGVDVRVHFVPGNHDRLAGVWPDVRRKVRDLLCIEDGYPDAPFPHAFEPNRELGYSLRVRHGHEYDRSNFSQPFDPAGIPDSAYEAPTLGDYVTVDMLARLAVAFRVHHARKLRESGDEGDRYRSVYLALTEFDDVRPASRLSDFFAKQAEMVDAGALAMLRPALLDVITAARADPFFVGEIGHAWKGPPGTKPVLAMLEQAVANAPAVVLGKILAAIFSHLGGDTPAQCACGEAGLDDGSVGLVIAGHTHCPNQIALHEKQHSVAYFLDSGTWRTRIDGGERGAFGRLRSYTIVFCYAKDEGAGESIHGFETWTGHLASVGYGPYVAHAPAPTQSVPTHIVEFLECRIGHIDEGDTRDGAELELHFGVDDAECVLRQDHVHDGQVLPLAASEYNVMADPLIDGEVWCWGLERDAGAFVLDRDDPLPWAIDTLQRKDTEPGAGFVPQMGELSMMDNRGSSLTLVYRVR